jgi:AmmeMemoRadiSam system protein A
LGSHIFSLRLWSRPHQGQTDEPLVRFKPYMPIRGTELNVHGLVALARRSVEEYVRNRKVLPVPEALSPEMARRAGVFVCIKKNGQLRGCIGTFLAHCENVAGETIRNSVSAAIQDPRFGPVSEDELPDLEYTVDVLSPPEKVADTAALDPKKYGVMVVSGRKRGLLLPDLEGVDSVEEQIRITRMKAGISPDEEIETFRFTVERYT